MTHKNQKMLILDEFDRTDQLWGSKKSSSVRSLLQSLKDGLKRKHFNFEKYKFDFEELKKRNDEQAAFLDNSKKEKNVREVANTESMITDELTEDQKLKLAKRLTPNNPWRPDFVELYTNPVNQVQIWRINADILAQDIIQKYKIIRVTEKGENIGYFSYDSAIGHWELINIEDIRHWIDLTIHYPDDPTNKQSTTIARDLTSAKIQEDTLKLVRGKIVPKDVNDTFDTPPAYVVHFKTFDFDLKNWKFVEFKPDNFFLEKKNYDASCTVLNLKWQEVNILNGKFAPTWINWLTKSLGDKPTTIAFIEQLGYSFLHTYSPEQCFNFIRSDGGDGKSHLFELLNKLYGANSVAQLDFDQIAKDGSFDLRELRWKIINLTSDARATYVNDAGESTLKALSGGDKRQYPVKFGRTADFTNIATLWFNLNHYPKFQSLDTSIARRANLFEWHNIPNFDQKFGTNVWQKLENELGEMAALALIAVKKALNRSKRNYAYMGKATTSFTKSKAMIANYHNWVEDTDIVALFVKNMCVIRSGYRIGVRAFKEALNDYITKTGASRSCDLGLATITERLSNLGFKKISRKNWKDSHCHWHNNSTVYVGLTLKTIAATLQKDEDFQK